MIRVGPSLLHLNGNLVKGIRFGNDRVVGSLEQGVKVQNARNVDEVCLVDVSREQKTRSVNLIQAVTAASRHLRVPLLAGGGLKSMEDIDSLFLAGADRILVGRKAVSVGLAASAAAKYGSQSVVACAEIYIESGEVRLSNQSPDRSELSAAEYLNWLNNQGCGEVLIINRDLDGTRSGVQDEALLELTRVCNFPIAYQGGVREPSDAVWLAQAGFTSIFAGALFQFSRFTPNDLKRALQQDGFIVRL